jgi:ubiquinone/menaquinone biosynthesis C-methylase UbiE
LEKAIVPEYIQKVSCPNNKEDQRSSSIEDCLNCPLPQNLATTNQINHDIKTCSTPKKAETLTQILGYEYLDRFEVLPQGIPSIDAYQNLLRTSLFCEMESFSNAFVAKYAKAMKKYSDKWTDDSLHLWSRQWEYPFVFSHIQKLLNENKEKARILDAGSGCTFFSYYLTQKFNQCKVNCCDNDPSLTSIFEDINKTLKHVDFNVGDLASLGFEEKMFDIVYCISVLEHTENPEKIIKEFRRVLKADGLLILTFDVSLDNRSQISVEGAAGLFDALGKVFQSTQSSVVSSFFSDVKKKGILTTTYVRDSGHKELLPWRITLASIRHRLVSMKFRRPFSKITVFCSTWQASQNGP